MCEVSPSCKGTRRVLVDDLAEVGICSAWTVTLKRQGLPLASFGSSNKDLTTGEVW